MTDQTPDETHMKPTRELTGITINAMALIAPGAFLWTTYEVQATPGSSLNMWFSVLVACSIALLTSVSYASLSKRYPESGTGGLYYYATVAVLRQEEGRHFKWARFAKFLVGWASHLSYWIYPGVMVAFIGLLITYIIQTFVPSFGSSWQEVLLCIVIAVIIGMIASTGTTGSIRVTIFITIIQILAFLIFSILAIVYRVTHPNVLYLHPTALSVITPHDFSGLIFQVTIAILLVVGFESATAQAAEVKNPGRGIPRGVLLSLVGLAVIFYFIEYFGANFFINTSYGFGSVRGFDSAYFSIAPIGDMALMIGDVLLRGNGTTFALILGTIVVIAFIGIALSSLNTAVRVTYAMGQDTELPLVFGFLHGKYRTAIIVLTILSAVIGSYGVLNIDTLTQVILVSNIGTFLLYGMTCIVCVLTFIGIRGRNWFSTIVAPVLGAALNVAMLIGVSYYDTSMQDSSIQRDTIYAITFGLAWLVSGFGFLSIRKAVRGIPIFLRKDDKVILSPLQSILPVTKNGTDTGNPSHQGHSNQGHPKSVIDDRVWSPDNKRIASLYMDNSTRIQVPLDGNDHSQENPYLNTQPERSPNFDEGRLLRMSTPLEVFCCYAREDQEMLAHLKKHLTPLERQGQITIWSDTNLNAGVEWEKELHRHLESANIILLLISPDFMASDYCYSTEMRRAITRHNEGSAHVIPILLRSTFWQNAPFAKLQMVPTNAKPVTNWPDRDDAFHDITMQVNRVISGLRS